jgi:hypothetical protein
MRHEPGQTGGSVGVIYFSLPALADAVGDGVGDVVTA